MTNLMSYNGLDTRVGLTDSAGMKTFQRDGVGVTAPVLTDGTATFTASGENRNGTKTTFISALKNTDLQTNSSGAVTAERQYDAFGNVIAPSGAWTSQFGNAGRFGYQEDPDSGLKLLGHRYYDSATGRFLTRDPIKDGRNWYSYSENKPVSHVDPSGLVAVVAAGGLVVVIVGVALLAYLWHQYAKSKDIDLGKDIAQILGDGPEETPDADHSPGGKPSSDPTRLGPPIAPPIGKQDEEDPMIPVFRVGGPDGRYWSFEDPRTNPNYYSDYGMKKEWNDGNTISGGLVPARERGTTWIPRPTRGPDNVPIGNGKEEIIIQDPRSTVRKPWSHPWDGNFFR